MRRNERKDENYEEELHQVGGVCVFFSRPDGNKTKLKIEQNIWKMQQVRDEDVQAGEER